MTGLEVYTRIETLKEYQEALHNAINQVDNPNPEFGSTYPACVLKEIAGMFLNEQDELMDKLAKMKV